MKTFLFLVLVVVSIYQNDGFTSIVDTETGETHSVYQNGPFTSIT